MERLALVGVSRVAYPYGHLGVKVFEGLTYFSRLLSYEVKGFVIVYDLSMLIISPFGLFTIGDDQ